MIIPIGHKVVPFWGSYLDSYKVIPKRNYYGAYGSYQDCFGVPYSYSAIFPQNLLLISKAPCYRMLEWQFAFWVFAVEGFS